MIGPCMVREIYTIYLELHKAYGAQGWWPLVNYDGINPTTSGVISGYHVGDYAFPRTRDEQFEICLGCFLTQNTSWTSVEKSLLNLQSLHSLTPESIIALDDVKLREAIKPSGYHNQKSRYIKDFVPFFLNLSDKIPSREELRACIGIGPETADSMLLYAFKQPEFVVDTYTKRIMTHVGFFEESTTYDTAKTFFEKALQNMITDNTKLMIVYQEYHALLVEHAKRYYNKKPYGTECWLKKKICI